MLILGWFVVYNLKKLKKRIVTFSFNSLQSESQEGFSSEDHESLQKSSWQSIQRYAANTAKKHIWCIFLKCRSPPGWHWRARSSRSIGRKGESWISILESHTCDSSLRAWISSSPQIKVTNLWRVHPDRLSPPCFISSSSKTRKTPTFSPACSLTLLQPLRCVMGCRYWGGGSLLWLFLPFSQVFIRSH